MKAPLNVRTRGRGTVVYILVLVGVLATAGIYSKPTPQLPDSYPEDPVGPPPPLQEDSTGYQYFRRTVEYESCRQEENASPAGFTLTPAQLPIDSCKRATQHNSDSLGGVYTSGNRHFYSIISEDSIRREHTFQLVLQNELTNPSRLDSLRRGLRKRIGSSIEDVGFDSIRIGLESDRRKIERELEQGNIHLAVVPSNVVVNITENFPSLSDWEYQFLLSHDTYRSAIISLRDTPIRELKDLKQHTVAAPHERSSSGYKVPMGYLGERGIQPRVQFLDGEHPDVWRAVLKGHVKAGFTHDGFRNELPPEKAGRLTAIKIPIRIPGSVWVLREDVTELPGVESGVRRALRDFVESNENPYWSQASRPDAQKLEEYDTYRRILNEME